MPIASKPRISESFGVSVQFIKLLLCVIRKTLAGIADISVLSQIIPANVRFFRIVLADLVKLPF